MIYHAGPGGFGNVRKRADRLEERLKPGDFLGSENELARQFSVSRITVRDALRSLSATGIVEIRQGGRWRRPHRRRQPRPLRRRFRRAIPACGGRPYFYELYGCKICLMECPFNNQSPNRKPYAPVITELAEQAEQGLS